MKNIFYLIGIVLLFAAPNISIGQCNIDTTVTRVGFSPGNPRVIQQNIAYQQTVQVYIPTTYSGLQLDSLHLDSITGMPGGITYVLNPASGTVPAGGHGAFCFSGTTTDTVGPYPLTFYGYVYTTAQAIPFSALAGQFSYVLRVEALPGATFSVDSPLCSVDDSITFTDHTTGYPTRWAWTFQGGSPSTSTLQFPHVLYDTTGVLRVTLIARNGVGADTINRFVTVFAGMQGTLNTQIASSATAADGSATITVSLGTPPYSYHWNNGTSDSSITNVVAGLYSVSVSDANGCVYVNDTIYINFVNEIKQVASNVVVKLYPNPAMDIMNITLPQSAEALINFIDASGATVKRVNMKNSSAVSVPVNDLPAGTYLLRITDLHGNFEIASGRFIKL